jgi:hypothetical protein
MRKIGPQLERLTRRLAETPPDFFDEPKMGSRGRVHLPALVNDLLARYGRRAPAAALDRFRSQDVRAQRNRLALAAIAVWLLTDEELTGAGIAADAVLRLLDKDIGELAAQTAAKNWVDDPERREELARFALARLELRPAGETEAQAADRLSALSQAERRRLIKASRTAEARARAIREALVKKRAAESADKWTRE